MNYAITLHILLDLCLKQELSILELGKKKTIFIIIRKQLKRLCIYIFCVHSYCLNGIFN